MPAPFERLKVWQLSHKLALEIYQITAKFPAEERYGLSSQLRRAAVAIPTNIAEGNARNHRREYLQFCYVARGSVAEVKSLIRFSCDLGYLPQGRYAELLKEYEFLGAFLQKFIRKMEPKA